MPAHLPLTLPDVIENSLAVRFDPVELGRWEPEPERLGQVAVDVGNFYKNFPSFAKEASELRPYISDHIYQSTSLKAKNSARHLCVVLGRVLNTRLMRESKVD
jgi:hypothetical protein